MPENQQLMVWVPKHFFMKLDGFADRTRGPTGVAAEVVGMEEGGRGLISQRQHGAVAARGRGGGCLLLLP